MPKFAYCLTFVIVAGFACPDVSAQVFRGRVIRSQPVYSAPQRVIHHSQVVHQSHPIATQHVTQPATSVVPDCGCAAGGDIHAPCKNDKCDCDCKHLHCEIRMTNHCYKEQCTKDPLENKPMGKIDVRNYDTHCYGPPTDFKADTRVPVIICKTEKCVEIGKQDYDCLPGCKFTLCVPINDCLKKTITCELVEQEMMMRVFARSQNGVVTYDVYVLNQPSGPHSAGGMPAKWVLMHCATWAQVEKRFPGVAKPAQASLKTTAKGIVLQEATKANPEANKELYLVTTKPKDEPTGDDSTDEVQPEESTVTVAVVK